MIDEKYVNAVIGRPDLILFEVVLRYMGEREVCIEHKNKRLDIMSREDFLNAYKLVSK